MAFIALLTGVIGLVIGHKIRRYGKIAIIIIAAIAGILGGTIGMISSGQNPIFLVHISLNAIAVVVATVALIVGLYIWVYKLTKSMMVH
jgi:uncharacterized membrane protein YeiH